MKCLVLAGGIGERLWPLSRKNFPKQFIELQKNHSVFQETIARNIPFCDEFIIVTSYEYRDIITNQMETFQGVAYRCIFEEEPRNTTAAVTLACLELQPHEFIFVIAADQLIEVGSSYKDSILKAKNSARDGRIVLFGKPTNNITEQYGYYTDDGFFEKPDRYTIRLIKAKKTLQNLGMFLFQNGLYLNEMKILQPELLAECQDVYSKRCELSNCTLYKSEVQKQLTSVSIEKSIIEKSDKLECVEVKFDWNDIGNLEDLSKTKYDFDGIGIQYDCSDTVILNNTINQAVVVNELDNVLVVNTSDAVYVGRRGKSHLLKQIIHDNPELESYSNQSNIVYRKWGFYENVANGDSYRVRRITIMPGKTIYGHRHNERKENWTVVSGTLLVSLDGKKLTLNSGDSVDFSIGTIHQISNIGENSAVVIETAFGNVLLDSDTSLNVSKDVTEFDLGLQHDPIVKLSPIFKDYLWGGTKLRDLYKKQCDYDVIAESWELSAHPAGNCTIASGRHKGLSFSQYLNTVGKSVVGWKWLQDFPLLIKFIDAKDNLSVQIHPDDDYALEKENEYGKNEMWYVIDSEPGAGLYVGFNRDVNRNEVEQRIKNNTILDVLNFYPTKPGDVFFIPAGTVHAIGAGNLIYEIQQSSNCTYRLYDYDRRDKFGNPRELHLQKALDVMNYKKFIHVEYENNGENIGCKYFEVKILQVDGKKEITLSSDSFYVATCIKGNGFLTMVDSTTASVVIGEGETVFIPAINRVLIFEGTMKVILSHI